MRPIPRVSIFYAHGESESDACVTRLATSLRALGIDVKLDKFVSPPEGWVAWMGARIQDGDFLIVV